MLTYNGTSQAVIDSPGDYTIDRDLTQTNPAQSCIIINPGVHYVTIRLRSRVTGSGNPGSTNYGISANGSAMVSVLGDGGSIRGFGYGVRMDGCFKPTVQNLSVVDALFRGICITGDDVYVEGCRVQNVKGATWTPNAYCMGIEVSGMSAQGMPKIIRNTVHNIQGSGSGESVGISITDNGTDGVIHGNVVKNPAMLDKSWGLWIGGDSAVTTAGNLIDTYYFGVGSSSPTRGFLDENAIINCHTLLMTGQNVVIGGMDG
jgi:hypothetical protein